MSRCVIKADDFYATQSDRWLQFLLLCKQEGVPASLGFIAKRLRNGKTPHPRLVRLAKQPRFEVWNHGTEHWKDYTSGRSEFFGPAVADQVASIERCQVLCEQVFGHRPKLFGPPFNAYDANTLRALRQFPELEWLYDIAWLDGKTTLPKHYFVSCDVADSGRRFNPERARKQSADFMIRRSPFVIQIHPGNHWTDECFVNFQIFLRYIQASGYRFVLPGRLFASKVI